MPTNTLDRTGGAGPSRIMLIDDHEISRAACRALLRTEGIDVVADLAVGDPAIVAADALRPDVVVVDVSPSAGAGFGMARRLMALADAPAVVLTSSAEPAEFGRRLDGHRFVTKAGLCAKAIRDARPRTSLTGPPHPDDGPASDRATGSPASRLATSLMSAGAHPGDCGDLHDAPHH